jgi:hypothetical protein
MKRATFSKAVVMATAFAALSAVGLLATRALADDDAPPPPEYIATVEPVYYEGHPAYYYGNRWYYRDGARWGHYNDEPAFLRDRRFHTPAGRFHYAAGARGGFRGGRGGRR